MMTRNEAKKIIENINESGPLFILDAVEALGLIKFDEEKKVPSPASIIALEIGDFTTIPHALSDKIIDALLKYGYKVIKK